MTSVTSPTGFECSQSGAVVSRLIAANETVLRALTGRLRARPPRFVIASARGSSSHAAYYGKYLIEQTLGLVVAAAVPSVQTIYAAPLHVEDALFITVSQSGRSPDLVAMAEAARRGGALTVAMVNDAASPLAGTCEFVLPLRTRAPSSASPPPSLTSPRSRRSSIPSRAGPAMPRSTPLWSGCPEGCARRSPRTGRRSAIC